MAGREKVARIRSDYGPEDSHKNYPHSLIEQIGKDCMSGKLRCQLCNDGRETIKHIVSKCATMTQNGTANHKICDLLKNEVDDGLESIEREENLFYRDSQTDW